MAKTKKRGNGEGSIYKRGNKWYGLVTVGRDAEGKLVRKPASGSTKTEVAEKLREISQQYKGIDLKQASSYTVAEWVYFWLENYAKPQLEETSFNSYKHNLENHIVENFGHYKLTEITGMDIQVKYNQMFSDKEKYSSTTLKYVHNKFKLCLKQAVSNRMIAHNPCEGVLLPKARTAKKVQSMTVEEQQKLVEHCETDEYLNLFIFLVGTGMRIGEALGLTWDNVDLEERNIHIVKTMIEIHGNPSFKNCPKTDSGLRTIPMSKRVHQIVLDRREAHRDLNHLNLVFFSSTYNFRTTANLRRLFQKTCDNAGIKQYNLHALRHTFATRMIEKDCNIKVLSAILGHKDIRTTLQTYTDALDAYKKEKMTEIDIFS